MTKETVAARCMQIVGQNRFLWPLKDDTAEYELQLTRCRHSATSNGCDEIPFPLAYSGAIDGKL